MAVTSAKVTILDPATGQITIVAEDADIFGTGTLAARPAAGSGNGDMYVVNDPLGTYQIDLWDGAVWRTLGPDATVSVGNTLFVDAVNGNNATAVSGRLDLPYLTIAAALAAAVSGDLVYVLPGSYDETSLVIPDDVTLAGIDRLRCVISHTSLDVTTVVTMGINTSLENLTIEAGSPVSPATRTLVEFPGISSASSVARNLMLTGTVGNVNGVYVYGTGVSQQNWVTLDMVDIKGTGVANGLLASSGGFFVIRDCVCSGQIGVMLFSGTTELQDTKCSGVTGLSIGAWATCYVNLATRWIGPTPLVNAGSLRSAGGNLYTNAGGDLSGTMPDPAVAAITETAGPTQLVIGAIADGEVLTRSGATLIGAAAANIAQYRRAVNQTINTSATTITLDATDFEDSNYTRAGADITINTAGVYKISYSVYFDTNTNARRTVEGWIENNMVEIVPSRSAGYSRNNYDDTASCAATFLVSLAASDIVRLRSQSTGSVGTAEGQANRIWICLEYMRA